MTTQTITVITEQQAKDLAKLLASKGFVPMVDQDSAGDWTVTIAQCKVG